MLRYLALTFARARRRRVSHSANADRKQAKRNIQQARKRVKEEFGYSPANFVEKLRLDEARGRLSAGDNSIENVGLSVGFKSSDAFRRAFEHRLGLNPSDYRRRFSTAAKTEIASRGRRELHRISVAA